MQRLLMADGGMLWQTLLVLSFYGVSQLRCQ